MCVYIYTYIYICVYINQTIYEVGQELRGCQKQYATCTAMFAEAFCGIHPGCLFHHPHSISILSLSSPNGTCFHGQTFGRPLLGLSDWKLREVTVPSRVRIIKFLEHVTMLQVLGSSRVDHLSRSEQGMPSQEPLQKPVDLASFYLQLGKGTQ